MLDLNKIELYRQKLQTKLDSEKTQKERNQLGQFATPQALADQILSKAKGLLKGNSVRFLDPALGTGSFYSSLVRVFERRNIKAAMGFEIDLHYGTPTVKLWETSKLNIVLEDFTKTVSPENEKDKFNLVVCNPPYVRHHHIPKDEKQRFNKEVSKVTETKVSQLMGLYGIFLLLSANWMKKDGVACWLIPSEFLYVNYGRELKKFLLEKVELLQIHRFDPSEMQFNDALVSSAIVVFRNTPPDNKTKVSLTFGGSLETPKNKRIFYNKELDPKEKWNSKIFNSKKSQTKKVVDTVRFGELFSVKRGVATGANEFFILDEKKVSQVGISPEFLRPILPSPRSLKQKLICANVKGAPKLDNPLFLLSVNIPLEEVKTICNNTYSYIKTGLKNGVSERYLCRNRKMWYEQEKRDPAPIMVTYMGRSNKKSEGSTFRFIRNRSNAIGTNTYLLLYPTVKLQLLLKKKSSLLDDMWKYLNEKNEDLFISGGRVYGGGLHKLEPKELANIELPMSNLLN